MKDLEKRWEELVLSLEKNINDELSLKSILFLISKKGGNRAGNSKF